MESIPGILNYSLSPARLGSQGGSQFFDLESSSFDCLEEKKEGSLGRLV